jgi:hypothetical protein
VYRVPAAWRPGRSARMQSADPQRRRHLLTAERVRIVVAPGAGACPFSTTAIMFPSGSRGAVPSGGVLYDQYDHVCAVGTGSQNFEASLNANDDESADDFVVPSGQRWTVDGVEVDGLYLNGPGSASSVNVRFYANGEGNLPGALEAERFAQPFTGTGGDFVITVGLPVTLKEGIHWYQCRRTRTSRLLDSGFGSTVR